MARKTITSTNTIFTLSVEGLYAGVRIQGFSADMAFDMDAQEIARTVKGVDGKMSGGFRPQIYPMNIQLQADSESIEVFDTIYQYMQARREVVWLSGSIESPATKKTWALSNGILVNYSPMPAQQEVQSPQRFTINWDLVVVSKL